MNQEIDEFYYADLIYVIKGLANLGEMNDLETNARIIAREQLKEIKDNGKRHLISSRFTIDLVHIINDIGIKIGKKINNFQDISLYPDVVLSIIENLEKKNEYSLVRK